MSTHSNHGLLWVGGPIAGCSELTGTPNGPSLFGGWLSIVIADALSMQMWYRPGMNLAEHAFEMTRTVHTMYPSMEFVISRSISPRRLQSYVQSMFDHPQGIEPRYRQAVTQNAAALVASEYFAVSEERLFEVMGQLCTFISGDIKQPDGKAVLLIKGSPQPVEHISQRRKEEARTFTYDAWALLQILRPGVLTTSDKTMRFIFAAADALNRSSLYVIVPTYDAHLLDV